MTTGLVVWNLISQTVLEGSDSFIAASDVLRQASLPAPLFVWRVVWRNVLTFVHQLPVLVVLALMFHYLTRIHLGEALAGLVLILINVAWFALLCAVFCARFRDLKQILASLMQLLFFLSPVLWIPSDMKGLGHRLMALNPVVAMLDVLRGPLIGEHPALGSVLYLVGAAFLGWVATVLVLAKARRRIVHYV
jgi:lipopolysaccharide transport system permease protein